MKSQNQRDSPSDRGQRGRREQIDLLKSNSDVGQLASVTSSLILAICVEVGCHLKEEESQKDGDGQRR